MIFRMFVNTYPLAGEYPFSSATVSGDDVQDLFANGGSFWASFYDIHDTESVGVNEQVTVNIESDNGESSVFLDGFPSIFGPGYIFYDSEDENFDATDIRARSLNSREVSGVPDNRGVVGEVLQFGISGREMFIDDDVAIVTLEVEDARDGDDLYIYHSPTLKGGWTNEGLSSETCTVEDGLCVFETQTLSYFVATGKSVRRRTSGGSSGGGSVANTYTAQIIPTDTVPVENKSTSPIVKFLVNLKLKSAGEEVKTLQIFLNKNGFLVNTAGSGSLGQETNYFGPKTKAALILFQKAHTPLVADGVLGPKTVAVVNGLQ